MSTIKRAILLAVIGGSVFLVMLLVNQTAALVRLVGGADATAGRVLLGSIMALYGGIALALLFLWLQRPLRPPAEHDPHAIDRYVRRWLERLRGSPLLQHHPLETRADLDRALRILDAEADRIIEHAGRQTFVSSAISQHGSLDGVIIFGAQARMILQLARVYYVRPRLRELGYLARQVGGVGFVAAEHEEVALVEDAQPIIASVVGSAIGAIPGFQVAGTLVVNGLLRGSANSFLTLRLGAAAREHCRAVVVPPKLAVRRRAFDHASALLREIAVTGGRAVMEKVWQETSHSAKHSLTGLTAYLRRR